MRVILGVNSLLCMFVYIFCTQNYTQVGTCEYAAPILRGLFYTLCKDQLPLPVEQHLTVSDPHRNFQMAQNLELEENQIHKIEKL